MLNLFKFFAQRGEKVVRALLAPALRSDSIQHNLNNVLLSFSISPYCLGDNHIYGNIHYYAP